MKPMKYKIIALCGMAGSGKDRTLNALYDADQSFEYPQLHKIVGCTTRPKRENEQDGVHYHFLSPEQFATKVVDGSLLEATSHRDWFYGTAIESLTLSCVNVGVFNPLALNILYEDPRVDLKVYRIAASDKTRMLRQLNREGDPDVDEIVRRYGTDKRDFAEIEFPYETLQNETEEDLWNNVNFLLSSAASFGQS
jgi:guanylate kinase